MAGASLLRKGLRGTRDTLLAAPRTAHNLGRAALKVADALTLRPLSRVAGALSKFTGNLRKDLHSVVEPQGGTSRYNNQNGDKRYNKLYKYPINTFLAPFRVARSTAEAGLTIADRITLEPLNNLGKVIRTTAHTQREILHDPFRQSADSKKYDEFQLGSISFEEAAEIEQMQADATADIALMQARQNAYNAIRTKREELALSEQQALTATATAEEKLAAAELKTKEEEGKVQKKSDEVKEKIAMNAADQAKRAQASLENIQNIKDKQQEATDTYTANKAAQALAHAQNLKNIADAQKAEADTLKECDTKILAIDAWMKDMENLLIDTQDRLVNPTTRISTVGVHADNIKSVGKLAKDITDALYKKGAWAEGLSSLLNQAKLLRVDISKSAQEKLVEINEILAQANAKITSIQTEKATISHILI